MIASPESIAKGKELLRVVSCIVTREGVVQNLDDTYQRARALVEEGACLRQVGDDDVTALTLALSRGCGPLALLLVESGADPGHVSKAGTTPLMLASGKHTFSAFLGLLKKGVDLHAQTAMGSTALHFAAIKNGESAALVLVKRGVAIDKQGEDGYTALMWAIQKFHHDFARMLVEQGADCTLTNDKGQTILDLMPGDTGRDTYDYFAALVQAQRAAKEQKALHAEILIDASSRPATPLRFKPKEMKK